MTNKTILLAYHSINQEIAIKIDQTLFSTGYTFEHLACNEESPYLHDKLRGSAYPILLLISDNFLKSSKCMYDLLPVFQDLIRNNKVKTIITDGIAVNPETGEQEIVSTSFDRVSNVIKYMNYWQDEYLAVRRRKREMTEEEEVMLNQQLSVIRSISSEIGEFLRFLRNRDHNLLEDFEADAYGQFFAFVDDAAGHEVLQAKDESRSKTKVAQNELASTNGQYAHESDDLNVDISDIPGITLLPNEEENLVDDNEEMDFLQLSADNTPSADSLVVLEQREDIQEQAPAVETLAADDYHRKANQALEQGRVEEAMSDFEQGIAVHPDNEALQYGFAKALIQYKNENSKAKVVLERLIQISGDNKDAHFLLGELAEMREDYHTARFHFDRVIAIDEAYPEVHYRLANILANQYDASQAQAAALFEQAIQSDPNNADAHYQYAVLQDESYKDTVKAATYFEKTLELEPDHPFANYDLAVLFYKEGQKEQATRAYQLAVEINPELKTAQNDQVFLTEATVSDESEKIEAGEVDLLAPNQEDVVEDDTADTSLETALKVLEETPDVEVTYAASQEEEPVVAENLITRLQSDIKRLEELVLKNQSILQTAQKNIAAIPTNEVEVLDEEEGKEEISIAESVEEAKLVVITGATSGIGKATADLFAANGYRLILTGRRTERLEEIKKEYEKNYNADVLLQAFDVRDPLSVEEMVESLSEEWSNVDLLINNAGLAKGFEPIHEGKLEDWETMIDTNIKGLLYMTRAIAPNMVKNGGGHIINVCSIAGQEVYPNGGVYCATKHAVDALTKGMRLDLHKHNIRVSQVSPAHVEETEFALVRFDGDKERSKIYNDFQPLKSSDVADTIFYIATRPAHVNIQDILVYGTQQASATVIDRSGRSSTATISEVTEEVQSDSTVDIEK